MCFCEVVLMLDTMTMITLFFFFFTAIATAEIYTLSLHYALPISDTPFRRDESGRPVHPGMRRGLCSARSEEHTSELQSHSDLVCRLLLEKKKITDYVTGESRTSGKPTD